jgi:tyrosyl-tRNA synthetase
VQQGGVSVNGTRADDPDRRLGPLDAQQGIILLRAGKKRLFRFDVR